MIVFRLTLPQYANDLSGTVASLFGGRWNQIGTFVLYTAQSSSLSILEHLVHIKGTSNLPKYLLSILDTGDSPVTELPSPNLSSISGTQKVGSKWITDLQSPILRVPSLINPLEHNFLINPAHPELILRIQSQEWFVYDDRLIHN